MQHLRRPVGIDVELEGGGALGAQRPLVVRTSGIAFDVDDLPVDSVDERGAADGAEGADAGRHLRIFDSQRLRLNDDGGEVHARADQSAERRAAAAGQRKTQHIAPRDLHRGTPCRVLYTRNYSTR